MFALVLGAASASAQVLRGEVVDEAGRPLAGATASTVAPDAPGQGVTTDAAGRFALRLPRLPATVEVRYLGYEPLRATIGPDDPLSRTFRLRPRPLELDGVEVSGENLGVALMREVIRRKPARRAALPPFTAERYTRFALRRRGEVVRVEEVLSDAYWRPPTDGRPGGRREIVLARHRRPGGRAFRYARPQPAPDFYLDDEVALDGFRFVGPTHPDALEVYDFRVGDRLEVDGRVLWEVAVRPRSPLASAFEGRLRVVDSLFVLAEAELRPSVTLDQAPPVEGWAATYRQTFAPEASGLGRVGDSVWLPVQFEVDGRVDVGVPGARLPTVRVAQTTVVTNRRPGAAGGDSLFARADAYVEPPFVYGGADVYAAGRALAPPDADELRVLEAGTRPLRASLVPEGLLRNYVPLPVEDAPDEAPPSDALAPPLPRIASSVEGWYNRVQGVYLGVRPAFGVGDRLVLRPRLGVAPSPARLDAGLGLDARLPFVLAGAAPVLRVRGGVATVPFEPSAVYTQTLLSVPTYVGWDDYHDYLRRAGARASLAWASARVAVELAAEVARHDTLGNGTDYEGMFVGDGQRPNASAADGVLRAVTASVGVGEPPGWLARPSAFHAAARLEAGAFDPDGGETDRYVRLDGAVGARVPTLFRSRPDAGALYVGLRAATATSGAPVQRSPRAETRAGALSGFGAFRTRAAPPVLVDRFVQGAWEHDFGRALFEAVGWPVGVALTGGHLWEEVGGARRTAHEVGVGLLQPFGFPVRIDVATRLDRPGWFVGIGLAR